MSLVYHYLSHIQELQYAWTKYIPPPNLLDKNIDNVAQARGSEGASYLSIYRVFLGRGMGLAICGAQAKAQRHSFGCLARPLLSTRVCAPRT
jgi:hypothetical protein